ncbi:MAG: DUF72 domain-containing protein [Thermoprotei archaeon]
MIKVGTCGFTYKHFGVFDALEVQQTFYDVVSEETLKKWRQMAPETLEFTVKALQAITHPSSSPTYKRTKKFEGKRENFGLFRPNEDVMRALEVTLSEAKVLGARIIVFQTPESFRPTEENLRNLRDFASSLDKSFVYAWEPRGKEWDEFKGLKELLDELGFVHVVDPFRRKSLTEGMKYYRLHGKGKGEVNYRYKYTDEDLRELLQMVAEEKEAYVMFNNVYSFEDAKRFKEMIGDA